MTFSARGRTRLLAMAASTSVAIGAAAMVPTGVGASGHVRGSAAVCARPAAGEAACTLRVPTVDGKAAAGSASTPSGYGPADLRSAYNLVGLSAPAGTTVAIVDAYDDPNAAGDLATYRSQYGLPACGTGCFTKVNQSGGTKPPRANGGWAQEISLDIDMVSAICPNCRILLVEAGSASFTNLIAAEDYATAHANYVSNSWSGGEFSAETSSSYDGHFNKAGKVITASTGDSGFGTGYPATSRYVVGVGGTTLNRSGSGWTETAWSGAGSGCSAYEPQQSWQAALGNVTSVCGNRAVADVSADADPNTGVAVYDSYASQGSSGWLKFGGTSVSSPLIASVFALSGNTGGLSHLYANAGSLSDVAAGSNGSCGNDLCNAVAGWDGPTGLGTPNGVGAF